MPRVFFFVPVFMTNVDTELLLMRAIVSDNTIEGGTCLLLRLRVGEH